MAAVELADVKVTDGGGDGTAENPDAEPDMTGLSAARAAQLLEEFGRNEIPEVVKPWWKMLGEQFVGVMPFMIEIAMILAAALAARIVSKPCACVWGARSRARLFFFPLPVCDTSPSNARRRHSPRPFFLF